MEAVRVPTLNETVCDTLDYAYSLGQNRTGEASATVSASEYVIYGSSLFVSLTLLFFGARIMKPVAILSAAVGGFSFAYLVLENGFGADCTARIVSGVILASLGAGVTGCLFKVALFIIGAAAFGSIVHIIFLAAPSLHAVGKRGSNHTSKGKHTHRTKGVKTATRGGKTRRAPAGAMVRSSGFGRMT